MMETHTLLCIYRKLNIVMYTHVMYTTQSWKYSAMYMRRLIYKHPLQMNIYTHMAV